MDNTEAVIDCVALLDRTCGSVGAMDGPLVCGPEYADPSNGDAGKALGPG